MVNEGAVVNDGIVARDVDTMLSGYPIIRVLPFIAGAMLAGCDGTGGLAQNEPVPQGIPDEVQQLVFVTAPTWESTTGTLHRLERQDGWTRVGREIPVTLGRSGMAWGPGLYRTIKTGVQKAEGDGKAPAGVFALEFAFGYEEQPPAGLKLPYRQARERDYWVDDPNSPDYNQWKTIPESLPNAPAQLWRTAEKMRRPDQLYELGIVVAYNANPPVPGLGSAIFLHVWRSAETPTVGCTAMSRTDMLELMKWLDPRRKPLLIQAPHAALPQIVMN